MSDKIKIVMEIDKKDFERIITHAQKGFHSVPDIYALSQALSHSKPLSDVLNEIKTEIDNLDMEYDCNTYYSGVSDALEIIDKHIGKAESEA